MRLFLAALVLLLALPVHAAEPVPTEPVKLAVMYFENSGNDELEMLKVGLAQMLITDLSGEKRFDVVERTRLNELLAEQELQKTDKVDADTAVNLGRIIGARYMVLGAYFEVMGQLRVDARIVDVATSRIVSVGSRMPADNLWDLHDELVGAIADAIADAEIRRNAWDAAHPPKPRMRMRAPAMNDDSDRDAGSMGESFDDSVDESANFGEEVAEEIVEAPVRSTGGRSTPGTSSVKNTWAAPHRVQYGMAMRRPPIVMLTISWISMMLRGKATASATPISSPTSSAISSRTRGKRAPPRSTFK